MNSFSCDASTDSFGVAAFEGAARKRGLHASRTTLSLCSHAGTVPSTDQRIGVNTLHLS